MYSSGSHSCSILLRCQQALSQLRPLSVRRRLISLVYSRGFDAEDFDAVSPEPSKQPIPTQLTFYRRRRVYERAHVDKITLDVISLKCEASESVQFSTCYDPIHRF